MVGQALPEPNRNAPTGASTLVNPTPRTWRLNVRAASVLAAVVVVVVLAIVVVPLIRGGAGRSALLAQAKQMVEKGRPDLALNYVNGHLEAHPEDVEGLDLKSKL